jgi:hypothetical protein
LLPFSDLRSDKSSLGVYRDGIQRSVSSTYVSEQAPAQVLSSLLHSLVEKAGATVLASAEGCSVMLSAELEKLEMTVDGVMAGEETFGEIAFTLLVMDAQGVLLGKQRFERRFEDPDKANAELLGVELERLVATVLDDEYVSALLMSAKERSQVALRPSPPTPPTPDRQNSDTIAKPQPDVPPAAKLELPKRRLYLQLSGEASADFEKLLGHFQSPLLKLSNTSFAGSSDMDVVYAECRDELGVDLEEERKCQLKAAKRASIDELVQLEAVRVEGSLSLTMSVWQPESNELVCMSVATSLAEEPVQSRSAMLSELACEYGRCLGTEELCKN